MFSCHLAGLASNGTFLGVCINIPTAEAISLVAIAVVMVVSVLAVAVLQALEVK